MHRAWHTTFSILPHVSLYILVYIHANICISLHFGRVVRNKIATVVRTQKHSKIRNYHFRDWDIFSSLLAELFNLCDESKKIWLKETNYTKRQYDIQTIDFFQICNGNCSRNSTAYYNYHTLCIPHYRASSKRLQWKKNTFLEWYMTTKIAQIIGRKIVNRSIDLKISPKISNIF